ncbi:MarR family winged helix-turn-helix transcriptional regulator [Dyella nitratireducens]|uniref:HTH marR-type domain-containing protein n=1 Tax=Dyella nitratireducens TaxID=1849580 RepID=A0ABQ1GE92_9GAMM|nr:MarR family transcriptional regulator [Dyella nitratireducens]GGA41976.1 hypothetical protein GCM10010981_33750 [Dyella nitratireducens]GLQ42069.1 hypothetical protein GCM10007902_19190 [Dyella nitratireducens]
MNKYVDRADKSEASTGQETFDMTDVDALYKMAEVSRILKSATSTIEKLAHLASGTNDLTLMHCLVLVHLSRTVSCKQLDLKYATRIASPYLTKLIDELTIRGFVRRHRSSGDRRQIILVLTAPGRETALRLLASLHELTHQTQRDAIEQLGFSLKRFVITTGNEGLSDRDGKEN